MEARPHTWGWPRKGFKCSAKSVHSSSATCPRRDLMQPPMASQRSLSLNLNHLWVAVPKGTKVGQLIPCT